MFLSSIRSVNILFYAGYFVYHLMSHFIMILSFLTLDFNILLNLNDLHPHPYSEFHFSHLSPVKMLAEELVQSFGGKKTLWLFELQFFVGSFLSV